MLFDIQTKEQKIVDGYKIAEEMLLSLDIIERIEDVARFTYTKATSAEVATKVRAMQIRAQEKTLLPLLVDTYYYKNANVIGTTKAGIHGIFVNRNGISYKTLQTFIENGAHEVGHVPLGFSHGSNFPPGSWRGYLLGDREDKNFSVCHMLEKIVIQLAKEKGLVK